jgi:hypothetical protein
MAGTSQKRAVKNYRKRISARGLARFEVLGLQKDRDLIRTLAKKLAEEDAEARRLRASVSQSVAGEKSKKGGVWAALRNSPLVGADLDFTRDFVEPRKIDL